MNVKGVNELFAKYQDAESKGIKVHFRVDDSGLLNVDKIDVTFEKSLLPKDGKTSEESTLSKLGNKISSFFSNTNEDSKDPNQKTEEQTATPATATPTPTAANETLNATAQINLKNSTQPVANVTIKREDIQFDSVEPDHVSADKKRQETMKLKLVAIREKEKEKRKRAQAVNSLEAFIFDTKDKLSQDDFVKCTTEEEREKIKTSLDEADNWMSDADDSVETKVKFCHIVHKVFLD